jgi:PII-like signaling protein
MNQSCVRFFVHEGQRHEGRLLHDWLFECAREIGISGGGAYRASAGFGRHGLHEDTFFELAGELPEMVEFLADDARVDQLLRRVAAEGLRLRYSIHPVMTGITGE